MTTTIYSLHECPWHKERYIMTVDINNATFEGIGVRTIKEWALVTKISVKELKKFIKK